MIEIWPVDWYALPRWCNALNDLCSKLSSIYPAVPMHSVAFEVSCDEAIQCLCAEGVSVGCGGCLWMGGPGSAPGCAPGDGDFGFWLVVDFGDMGIGLD